MRLKKLEIQGFKSFADRTQITFEHGVTGIVGPNGCGKSNISDAVRWVLGEQSAKTLRGAKMEDVIFNGTEKRRRLSFCEVTLTFDNEDGALPIAFGEVAVTRRVYRSGESEYLINKAPCRLRDVVDLFRDTGIGKEGYSLIGQGRIDEILAARSEDRRQIFEEAAGIVKYKVRRNEAVHRMENTRLNLTRVEDILRELEARVEPLRVQSEQAREYLALRDELKTLELNAFLLRTERYTARINELRETLNALKADADAAMAQSEQLSAQRDEKQDALGALEDECAKMREGVQELIREVEADEGAVKVLSERIAATERDRARLQGDLDAAKQGSGGVKAQLEARAAEIEEKDAALSARAEAFRAREQTFQEMNRALGEKEAQLERVKAAVIDQMNRMSDVKSEKARLSAMREQLVSRVEALKKDEQSDDQQTADFDRQERDCAARLADEQARKRELENLSQDAAARVRALGEETEEIRQRMADLTAKKQETASRLKVLEEMQRDYEGYQFSVKNVLRRAERMGGGGVRGVVATLMNVPERYERAVDMALGGSLQHIVVDREEDAKGMIEFLKQNRMGRATFLPLSAVRGRTLDAQERRVLSMPGCLGVASELIRFDKVYQGIVDSLLGRTVIAENLDAGIAIMRAGRHAFRLVTLDGDVMNPGGAMTGGSVHSNVTSLLSREREVGENRALLSRVEQALAETAARQADAEEKRAALKRERAELFESLHQQDIACAREEAHLAAAREEQSAHADRTKRVGDARGQLETQLEGVNARLAQIDDRQTGENEERDARKIEMDALQRDVMNRRAETTNLQTQINDERVRIAADERDVSALKADRERLARQKDDIARLLDEGGRSMEECVKRLSAQQGELAGANASLQTAKNALDTARSAFRERDEVRTQAQKALQAIAESLDGVRAELDDLTDRQHRGEVQLTRAEAEFKTLTDRIWEDYELTYEGAQAFRDEAFKLSESEKRISQIRARVKAMGSVNVAAVDEYRETVKRFEELGAQRDDMIKAELDLQNIIEELGKKMETQFKREFATLDGYFQQTFVTLFGGGHAQLKLSDPNDALNCGIDIVAQPPGKKLQMLSLLSGGERALTAIAILFAMLKLKPTPFCILDEIEAALDDANIDNFAQYLKDYSSKTQFVVVTHRKGTMEKCDALYGVAMEEKGVSKIMSVRLS